MRAWSSAVSATTSVPSRRSLDRHAARGLKLGRESRPQRLARAAERDQILLARLGFGAGRQHPGGGMACPCPGRALVEHRHGGAALRQPPGDAKADHAGADDGDLQLGIGPRNRLRHSAAPFAGMTQTGSVGLISAASPRHPRPLDSISAFSAGAASAPQVRGGAGPCSSRATAKPTAAMIAAPIARVALGPIVAIPAQ